MLVGNQSFHLLFSSLHVTTCCDGKILPKPNFYCIDKNKEAGSENLVFMISFRTMQIFLNNMMGTSFTLDVSPTDSVEDVKALIKVSCLNVVMQELVYPLSL